MSHYTDLIDAFKAGWDNITLYKIDCREFRNDFVSKFADYLETDLSNVELITEDLIFKDSYCIFKFTLNVMTEIRHAPRNRLTYSIGFIKSERGWGVKYGLYPNEFQVGKDLPGDLENVFKAIFEDSKDILQNMLDYEIGAAQTKSHIGFV